MAERIIMPCIPLRGLTVFPNTMLHFDVGREKSIKALDAAMAQDKIVFLTAQVDENVLMPQPEDYFSIGVVCKVKQMLKVNGDTVRVLVEGLRRAEIKEVVSEDPYIMVSVEDCEIVPCDENAIQTKALMRSCLYSFGQYMDLTDAAKDGLYTLLQETNSPELLSDTIAMHLQIKLSLKQSLLEELNVGERLEHLSEILVEECNVLEMERDITEKVDENLKQSQKEYYLREQMKVIQDELGFGEETATEVAKWLETLENLSLPEKTEEKVKKEISRFSKMAGNSPDAAVIRNYVETILELPWHKASKTNSDIKKAEKILEEDHYGLDKVKERIVEYLAVVHLSKSLKGPILCLVGPPGVGKTSIARSIARATGREFARMSLGGVRDEAEIRGHRRTYIGAIPGRVINAIKDCGTNNPVLLFDEVDKIGSDLRGDPASALLEVLDPEQNKDFTDHYLEIPFDLSNVMFITTANSIDTIPAPLLDRMEVIEVSGYTEQEKINIAQRYLIPKQIKANGLKKKDISITPKALSELINYYTRESGVRNLEREIGSLCRKVARKIVAKKGSNFKITPASIQGYLGKRKYFHDKIEGASEVGTVTGMAWTSVGGETLFVETQVIPGTGQIQLTGQLGDVMQESARAAITYIRSIADKYNIPADFYKQNDIHVHVPEGAVPKDGPSAGVTMFTSVMSALTEKPVRKDVAMTGEITLRGKVLPVGGIKEKVLAAHRAGAKTILLPRENEKDIEEIPVTVRHELKFVLLDQAVTALEYAFTDGN